MSDQSIRAYDLRERVAAYDADMELMHPNRSKMVEVALEVLPFAPDARLSALDLGIGTSYFSNRFLQAFPNSRVCGLDGAEAMIDLAKARLGNRAGSVAFVVADFRDLAMALPGPASFDVVYSSYALHHTTRDEKTSVVRQAMSLLRPEGWFINADIIVAEAPEIEARVQDIRVRGIMERAGSDPRFASYESTRRFLDDMGAAEGDQPLTLREDMGVLESAGLRCVSILWLENREVVLAGRK